MTSFYMQVAIFHKNHRLKKDKPLHFENDVIYYMRNYANLPQQSVICCDLYGKWLLAYEIASMTKRSIPIQIIMPTNIK